MPAPVRKPPITLNWQMWALLVAVLVIVLLITVGVGF
jgi:hypothetical protein